MNVLLLRPIPTSERFGLGPFFRIEPLGMEYIARALVDRGHHVDVVDLRFTRPVEFQLARQRPRVVGIACMHALETDEVLDLARRIRLAAPEVYIVVGGHAAAAYPQPFRVSAVDAICVDDGERALPLLVEALEEGREPSSVPGFLVKVGEGFAETASNPEAFDLEPRGSSFSASSGAISKTVRLPPIPPDVAGRNRARVPFSLFLLLGSAALRSLRS